MAHMKQGRVRLAEQRAKQPKPDKPVNFSSFTKAELIRTIKKLDKRQTQLLNEVAKLKAHPFNMDDPHTDERGRLVPLFPWERDA